MVWTFFSIIDLVLMLNASSRKRSVGMIGITTLTVLSIIHFSGFVSAEIVSTGEDVEIKDNPTKVCIYQALKAWTGYDSHNYYNKNYNAQNVKTEQPKMEDIKIWIKEVQTTPSGPMYTHIVRIQLPDMREVLDEKKEMKVVDTISYGVNMYNFTNYSDTEISKIIRF